MRTLCTALLCVPSLFAQVNTGSLSRVVTDASGGLVTGAVVMLRNVETGVRQTSSSTGAGTYLFTPLQPGSYAVRVEAKDFNRSSAIASKSIR